MVAEWEETNLRALSLKIGSGATPRGGKNVYRDNGVAFIRSQNVYDNRFSVDGLARISEDAAGALKNVEVLPGDVLICITGESVTRTTIVPESVLPARVSQHVAIVRPNPKQVDSQFLKAALLNPSTKKRLNTISEAGATRRALTKSHLENTAIRLPGLGEQRRIAGVLGALDDLIDTNERLAAHLDQLFRALWLERFNGLDHLAGSTLGDLAKTQYGVTASASATVQGPKLLRVTDINKRNWVQWADVPNCELSEKDLAKYRLHRGDILVARMADPGKSAMVENEVDAVFASYLVRLMPRDLTLSYYIFGYLKSHFFDEYSQGAMTGSVQKHMNAKVIASAPIARPADSRVAAFNEVASPLREQLAACIDEARELQRTRDELLPLLLSGRVRVAPTETGGLDELDTRVVEEGAA